MKTKVFDLMEAKVFDLCLSFHQSLIRRQPSSMVISNAKKCLVDGDKRLAGIGREERFKANKLATNLVNRHDSLLEFQKADWKGRCKVYNSMYTKNPSDAAFDALKIVLYNDEKVGTAARKCGVNFQSVKVLKPRFELYITNAVELTALISKK